LDGVKFVGEKSLDGVMKAGQLAGDVAMKGVDVAGDITKKSVEGVKKGADMTMSAARTSTKIVSEKSNKFVRQISMKSGDGSGEILKDVAPELLEATNEKRISNTRMERDIL